MPVRTVPIPDFPHNRFWSRVSKGGPVPAHRPELGACWEWTGHLNKKVRACLRINDREYFASRVSWAIHHSDPGPLMVCHKCDRPSCVNPDHLFLGTIKDNNNDRTAKGRQARGEGAAAAKLTEEQVVRIRKMGASGLCKTTIAKMFGVRQPSISNICSGKYWRFAGGPIVKPKIMAKFRTACPKGHPYDFKPDGTRFCKTCKKESRVRCAKK